MIWGMVGIPAMLLSSAHLLMWWCDAGTYEKGYRWWHMDDGKEDYEQVQYKKREEQ